MIQITAPLSVPTNKSKKFILNLNGYRNAHYHVLNSAKQQYKEELALQLQGLTLKPPVVLTYTLYPKTQRRTDIGNVLSIHQKFFEDALVEYGCLSDDNYHTIIQTLYKFGSVDPTNPRVEIKIVESIYANQADAR